MFDENEHTHPQNNDEGPRHIHRGIKRSEPDEVEAVSYTHLTLPTICSV